MDGLTCRWLTADRRASLWRWPVVLRRGSVVACPSTRPRNPTQSCGLAVHGVSGVPFDEGDGPSVPCLSTRSGSPPRGGLGCTQGRLHDFCR